MAFTKCAVLGLLLISLLSVPLWAERTPIKENVKKLRSNLLYPVQANDFEQSVTNTTPTTQYQLNFEIPFRGTKVNYTSFSLFGLVSFNGTRYETPDFPLRLHGRWPYERDAPFIAALAGVAKTTVTGSGLYTRIYSNIGAGNYQNEADLKQALKEDIHEGIIGAGDFVPKHCIFLTWKNVSSGFTARLTNTYQLALVTDEIRTYVIFNYQNISRLPSNAFVGFNGGNGTGGFNYSTTMNLQRLNSTGYVNGFPGRHIFRVDQEILQGTCISNPSNGNNSLLISPSFGPLMGGIEVNITGPCLEKNDIIGMQFSKSFKPCTYRNRNVASCIIPPNPYAGFVDVAVTVSRLGDSVKFTNKFFLVNPMLDEGDVNFGVIPLERLDIPAVNITWNHTLINARSVNISVVGFNHSDKIRFMDEIVLANSIPNNGSHWLPSSRYFNGKLQQDFQLGLVMIKDNKGALNSVRISSKPIPLGWYFKNYWQQKHSTPGSTWQNKFCTKWIDYDKTVPRFETNLPECPCTLKQADADKSRFVADYGCDIMGNRRCYGSEKLLHCVRSAQPTATGAGQHCCYGHNGELMLSHDVTEFGYPNRFHPFYPTSDSNNAVQGLSHLAADTLGHLICCDWGSPEDCFKFRKIRQSEACANYTGPGTAVVFGDPHIITFSEVPYTFNGKGEFTLVSIRDKNVEFDVQGRFEQVWTTNKVRLGRATELTSIVAASNGSSVVEVKLHRSNPYRYKLRVLVDGKDVFFDRPSHRVQIFKDVTVSIPSNIRNQSHVIASFSSGIGVEVLEVNGHVSGRVYLPKSFMNSTVGLMGNWTKDPTKTLAPPANLNLPSVSANATFNTIHSQFGRHWNVSSIRATSRPGSKSLFHYDMDRTSEFYYQQNFTPIFQKYPTINSTSPVSHDAVTLLCGLNNSGIYQCRYDYIVSEDRAFAIDTRNTLRNDYDIRFTLNTTMIRCPPLQTPLHGSKSTLNRFIGTDCKFGCDQDYILQGEPNRTCLESGKWSPGRDALCVPRLAQVARRRRFI